MATKILQGDCIEKMRELPDECVHCCVTSPPYFGLRSYLSKDDPLKVHEAGTEQTPEAYVQKMVEVFREVRRVLRSDGVLWLNLGDSYASKWPCNRRNQIGAGSLENGKREARPERGVGGGVKEKDLIGIPHRVAFALQADGWYLRAICPWLKRNGMPESCRDRPTQVIEYIFLLTKSQKYFYDSEATKAAYVADSDVAYRAKLRKGKHYDAKAPYKANFPASFAANGRLRRTSDWFFESQGLLQDDEGNPLAFHVNTKPYSKAHFATFPPKLIEPCILAGTSAHGCCSKCEAPWERVVERTAMVIDRSERTHELGRTRSSGTMVEPAKAITTGWQPTCECYGKFVDGVVCIEPKSAPESWNGSSFDDGKNLTNHPSVGRRDGAARTKTVRVYKSDLPLDQHPVEPCVVLDPFGGSGTTGEVAQKHGRNAVLIELNPAYIPLIEERAA